MSKKYIDINRLAVSMIAMLACAFIFSCSGVSWFVQAESVPALEYVENFLIRSNLLHWYSGILLCINVSAMTSIISNNFSKGFLRYIPLLYLACVAISASDIFILPNLLIVVSSIALARNINLIGIILRGIEVYIFVGAYQLLSFVAKTQILDLNYDLGLVGQTLYYIDFCAFLAILLIIYKEGDEHHRREGQKADGGNSKERCYLVCSVLSEKVRFRWKNKRNAGLRRGSVRKRLDTEGLTSSEVKLVYIVAVIQFVLVSMATAINRKFYVFLILYFIGFLPQKLSDKVRMDYHAATLLGCTIQSIASFYVVCAVVPDLSISIFFPVLAGAGFVAALVWFQKQIQRKEELEDLPPEDIEYLIAKSCFDDRSIEMARMWWIEGKTNREVADAVNRNESTVKALKRTIREAMEESRK